MSPGPVNSDLPITMVQDFRLDTVQELSLPHIRLLPPMLVARGRQLLEPQPGIAVEGDETTVAPFDATQRTERRRAAAATGDGR